MLPVPRPRVRPWQEDEGLAVAVERAWREDVAPALKHGGDRRSESAKENQTGGTSLNDGLTSSSILAKLKREDPMTAQAPFLIPVAV